VNAKIAVAESNDSRAQMQRKSNDRQKKYSAAQKADESQKNQSATK